MYDYVNGAVTGWGGVRARETVGQKCCGVVQKKLVDGGFLFLSRWSCEDEVPCVVCVCMMHMV